MSVAENGAPLGEGGPTPEPRVETPEAGEKVAQSPFDLSPQGGEELTPEQAMAKREATRARIAQVLERGVVQDRFRQAAAHLPEDRVPVWCRDRYEDVQRYEALGAQVERRTGGEGSMHKSGDDRIRIGDLILMSIPRDIMHLIDELHHETTMGKLSAGRREMLQGVPQEQVIGDINAGATIVRGRRD